MDLLTDFEDHLLAFTHHDDVEEISHRLNIIRDRAAAAEALGYVSQPDDFDFDEDAPSFIRNGRGARKERPRKTMGAKSSKAKGPKAYGEKLARGRGGRGKSGRR